MKLPSQILFDQHLKHFISVYFNNSAEIEDLIDHNISLQHTENNCNTCNTFLNVIQSIEERVLGEEADVIDWAIASRGYFGDGRDGDLTIKYDYDEI